MPTATGSRVYPAGWDHARGTGGARYAVRGSEEDGTARVPFASHTDAAEAAADAEERTGVRMAVVIEPGAAWAYQPACPLGLNQSRAAYQWLHSNGHVCNDVTHHRDRVVARLIEERYPGGIDAFIASGREPVVLPACPWAPREEPCHREACVLPPL